MLVYDKHRFLTEFERFSRLFFALSTIYSIIKGYFGAFTASNLVVIFTRKKLQLKALLNQFNNMIITTISRIIRILCRESTIKNKHHVRQAQLHFHINYTRNTLLSINIWLVRICIFIARTLVHTYNVSCLNLWKQISGRKQRDSLSMFALHLKIFHSVAVAVSFY